MKRSSPSSSADHHEAQWTLSARLVLLAAILFIGLNVAQVVYRFTIPSLGWAGLDPETEETIPQFRLLFNAVGAPSPLQPGDTVLAVDGIPSSKVLEGFPSSSLVPADWEAGKNILCEKPLGMTIAEAQEMIESCSSANVKLGCAFMMRFVAQHVKALKLIRDGKLGKPTYARAQL